MSQVDNTTVITYLKKQIVVRKWIEDVLKVKLGDDLISALRNGIVLCYLMVEIEPRSIPTIQVFIYLIFYLSFFFFIFYFLSLIYLFIPVFMY